MGESSQNQGFDGLPKRETWLTDVSSARTKRAYEAAISDFESFLSENSSNQLVDVTRKDIGAWRDNLAERKLSPASIRSKMAAISYLYDLLAEKGVIPANPVAGVRRPNEKSPKRVSSSVSRNEMKKLLDLPQRDSVRGLRDRAILAVLAYHQISPEEVALLKIGDLQENGSDGLPCFMIRETEENLRSIPIHAGALQRIYQYLTIVGQEDQLPLFRPLKNNVSKTLDSSLTASGIRKGVLKFWKDRRPKEAE